MRCAPPSLATPHVGLSNQKCFLTRSTLRGGFVTQYQGNEDHCNVTQCSPVTTVPKSPHFLAASLWPCAPVLILHSSALKMETDDPSETLVTFGQTTCHDIPQNSNGHIHCDQNLISQTPFQRSKNFESPRDRKMNLASGCDVRMTGALETTRAEITQRPLT